ncbi:hypothetical protein M8818_002818 [Zalaria obscura]|uniref:Uncharacterized protein n=1 Tax=Zalaria obscura TaxID=2024903 RepID=A0ACC3SHI7_9PEZI
MLQTAWQPWGTISPSHMWTTWACRNTFDTLPGSPPKIGRMEANIEFGRSAVPTNARCGHAHVRDSSRPSRWSCYKHLESTALFPGRWFVGHMSLSLLARGACVPMPVKGKSAANGREDDLHSNLSTDRSRHDWHSERCSKPALPSRYPTLS